MESNCVGRIICLHNTPLHDEMAQGHGGEELATPHAAVDAKSSNKGRRSASRRDYPTTRVRQCSLDVESTFLSLKYFLNGGAP